MKLSLNSANRAVTVCAAILVTWGASAAPNPAPGPTPHQLRNISARSHVLTGDRVLIGGFIIQGNAPKTVIVRAVGPSLTIGGTPLSGRLADPTLELYAAGNRAPIAANNDWRESQQSEIGVTGLQPTSDFESAIVRTLAPGSYTAVMRGRNNGTGIGVVEIYDLSGGPNPQLQNMSARAFVQPDNDVLIGGIIVGGSADEDATIRVVLRAIGPSLGSLGVPDALADPTLELFDANGIRLGFNDDAGDEQALELQETGLIPLHAAESAIVTSLGAGNYTAVVRGKGQTTGVALVEVFDVPERTPPG